MTRVGLPAWPFAAVFYKIQADFHAPDAGLLAGQFDKYREEFRGAVPVRGISAAWFCV
jgi:hypothetical protein